MGIRNWYKAQMDDVYRQSEIKAANKAEGDIVTMDVLSSDLNKYLNRGWKLEQYYSKGFTGLRMALISHTKQGLGL